jgi:hypothetical protein
MNKSTLFAAALLALTALGCGAPIVFEADDDENADATGTGSTGTGSGTGTGTDGGTDMTPDGDDSGGSGVVRRVFISATATAANLGGIAGADAKCQADANRPDATKTYKAFLVDGSLRRACTTANCAGGEAEHVDWPLLANTTYTRADGVTEIATTNAAGIFVFPLSNSIGVGQAWTGMNADWTTSTDLCTAWTANAAAANGSKSGGDATDDHALFSGAPEACSTTGFLFCVEVDEP